MKKASTLLAACLILTGCTGGPSSTPSPDDPNSAASPDGPAVDTTSTSSVPDSGLQLGQTVETDGFTITVFDYANVNDAGGDPFGAADTEICLHEPSRMSGDISMATVDPQYWGAVDADNRRFREPSSWGQIDAANPTIAYEDVAIDDCIRGWLLFNTQGAEIEAVEYSKPSDDYSDAGYAKWLIPAHTQGESGGSE